ncbi:MAG: outer membrane protein transport protein [Lentisphaeria bacterium]|nr:outer membrane protein transport protein [Lentisphaeria bacterium]
MKKVILSLAVLLVGVSVCLGSGFQLYSESAADVLGIAGASVARNGHASAAWYNPASTIDITRPTFTGGGSALKLSIDYKTSVRTDHLDDQPRYAGFFYGVYPLNDDFRLNLSVNAPCGMITQWNRSAQLSTMATFTSLRVCYITPSITWKATEKLSLAAGPSVTIGVARLANYIDLRKYGQGMNKNYMSADAFGLGGFLAAYYKLTDDWAFGAKYQSRVAMTLRGKARYRHSSYLNRAILFKDGAVHTRMDMPAFLALGVQNTSLDNWTFLFEALWTEFSSYKHQDIHFRHYPGGLARGKAANPRKWHDVWSYHFGVEYKLTDHWLLRGGYCFDYSPANKRYVSPEMPDADKHLFTCGVEYQGETWDFALSYGYTRFQRTKLGTASLKREGISERGVFHSDCHILSASVTLKF